MHHSGFSNSPPCKQASKKNSEADKTAEQMEISNRDRDCRIDMVVASSEVTVTISPIGCVTSYPSLTVQV